MQNTKKFDQKLFKFSNKNLHSSVMTLGVKSENFVSYLRENSSILIDTKKSLIEFILTHVEVTINGMVLFFCFKNNSNQTLKIKDDEP